jgi:hypothetical protein
MRTYDDSFSGQKIYPGKVGCFVACYAVPTVAIPNERRYRSGTAGQRLGYGTDADGAFIGQALHPW